MARISFMKGVESDRNLAFKLLERVDPKLAPPAVVYRRERAFWKDLAGMTPEEQLRIEEMTDEEATDNAWAAFRVAQSRRGP